MGPNFFVKNLVAGNRMKLFWWDREVFHSVRGMRHVLKLKAKSGINNCM